MALVELLGRQASIFVPRIKVTALHVRMRERNYKSNIHYLQHHCEKFGVQLLVRDTDILPIENAKEKDPCFLCSWYRRKVLFDVAQEIGCNKIALGHHRDDILETLLMNTVFQGTFSSMPPKLQMNKMPLEIIRPLCLIDEDDIRTYAELTGYQQQTVLCPYEHTSSRTDAHQWMKHLQRINPDIKSSLWHALRVREQDCIDRLPRSR
ncbi:MAG: tRNA 2-thiocytidine biosynthesis TtcA family protein [Paludibacteraceae bacterium]|nr:tRNA 2-thiocytidine biosynthesis TtcA family protein [Paludibacteraceae bacterium]